MNRHSVLSKAIPKRKLKSTKILRKVNFARVKIKKTLERNPKSKIQNKNGGENRTRTCKPLRAVVFKTTALANYAISPRNLMSFYTKNFFNVMERVTNTTKHIIFAQLYFVIHNISVELAILFYL